MRSAILLLVLSAAILGSCTSAYKTGQTPDDVYFSPERPQDKYVTVRDQDEDRYQGNDYYDDQYLRMKVHNRMMWSELDDPYFYNPAYSYTYSYYNNWSNAWNPYTSWNYYYNPYCSPVIYTTKTATAYNRPRVFNLNTYNNSQTNSNYTKGSILNNNNYNYSGKPVRIVGYTPSNSSGNNNSSSGAGNFLRNIFNSSSNSGSSSNNNSSIGSGNRSSGSSSGSSGSSGGGGGVSAPARRF